MYNTKSGVRQHTRSIQEQRERSTSVQRACQYLNHIDVEIMHEEVHKCTVIYLFHTVHN